MPAAPPLHLVPSDAATAIVSAQLTLGSSISARMDRLIELCDLALGVRAGDASTAAEPSQVVLPFRFDRVRARSSKKSLPPAAAPFVEPVYEAVLGGAQTVAEIAVVVRAEEGVLLAALEFLVPKRLKVRVVDDKTFYFPPRDVRRRQARLEGRGEEEPPGRHCAPPWTRWAKARRGR